MKRTSTVTLIAAMAIGASASAQQSQRLVLPMYFGFDPANQTPWDTVVQAGDPAGQHLNNPISTVVLEGSFKDLPRQNPDLFNGTIVQKLRSMRNGGIKIFGYVTTRTHPAPHVSLLRAIDCTPATPATSCDSVMTDVRLLVQNYGSDPSTGIINGIFFDEGPFYDANFNDAVLRPYYHDQLPAAMHAFPQLEKYINASQFGSPWIMDVDANGPLYNHVNIWEKSPADYQNSYIDDAENPSTHLPETDPPPDFWKNSPGRLSDIFCETPLTTQPVPDGALNATSDDMNTAFGLMPGRGLHDFYFSPLTCADAQYSSLSPLFDQMIKRVKPILSVAFAGAGHGSVVSSFGGISCNGTTGCSARILNGQPVTLTAIPDAGSKFSGFGSPCPMTSPPATTCTLSTKTGLDQTVSAVFDSGNPTITIRTAGTGIGGVQFLPANAVTCGSTCTAPLGTVVTLRGWPGTADQGSGITYYFDGFDGGCKSAEGTDIDCTFTVAGDTTVTAKFETRQTPDGDVGTPAQFLFSGPEVVHAGSPANFWVYGADEDGFVPDYLYYHLNRNAPGFDVTKTGCPARPFETRNFYSLNDEPLGTHLGGYMLTDTLCDTAATVQLTVTCEAGTGCEGFAPVTLTIAVQPARPEITFDTTTQGMLVLSSSCCTGADQQLLSVDGQIVSNNFTGSQIQVPRLPGVHAYRWEGWRNDSSGHYHEWTRQLFDFSEGTFGELVFTNPTAGIPIVIPAKVTTAQVRMWGGGGAGALTAQNGAGGGGGFASATVTTTPGETLTVMVGGGGTGQIIDSSSEGQGGFNGGGSSGLGGGGGGYSALKRGTSILVLAAGGGGGGNTGTGPSNGGPGGGATGVGGDDAWQPFACTNFPLSHGWGGGGGPTSGSASGGPGGQANGTPGQSGGTGTSLTGGNAGSGGAGGGGLVGGGGGGDGASFICPQGFAVTQVAGAGGGGGGSSFVASSGVSGATLVAGTAWHPGNESDPQRAMASGQGSASGMPTPSNFVTSSGPSGNGEVIIRFGMPPPPAPPPPGAHSPIGATPPPGTTPQPNPGGAT
jgi:hypothetical protein